MWRFKAPTASQVLATALALWAIETSSRTTWRSGCRLARTLLNFSFLTSVGTQHL